MSYLFIFLTYFGDRNESILDEGCEDLFVLPLPNPEALWNSHRVIKVKKREWAKENFFCSGFDLSDAVQYKRVSAANPAQRWRGFIWLRAGGRPCIPHTQRFSNPIPAGKTLWSSPAHPHGHMGPALLLGEDFVPWPCRQKPLRATAEHGEQKQIPKEEMNFHVDVQKMDPVTFLIYFLYYVSECIMIQIFLACSPFFMLSFLHDPSDSIFFPKFQQIFQYFAVGFWVTPCIELPKEFFFVIVFHGLTSCKHAWVGVPSKNAGVS